MGQVLLDAFEREEKFNESRERARSENGKREDKHSRRQHERANREGQKKEKKGTPFFSSVFESFEFFERFSTAGRSRFPPQNRGVGQKHKRSIG